MRNAGNNIRHINGRADNILKIDKCSQPFQFDLDELIQSYYKVLCTLIVDIYVKHKVIPFRITQIIIF